MLATKNPPSIQPHRPRLTYKPLSPSTTSTLVRTMSTQHPKTPSQKPYTQIQDQDAFIRGFMDRKNNSGVDPRHFWPYLIPVPWTSVPGVGWPQQFPGSFIDPTHVFAGPSSTRQHQQQKRSTSMSQENDSGPPANGPPSSPRRAQAEPADPPGTMVSGGQQQQHHLPTDRALQQLARQLDDAIAFCQECLKQHGGDVERVAPYMDTACRNALWQQLLKARLRASARDRHLFVNLREDVEYWVQRAMEAAAADVEAARFDQADSAEERARLEDVVHEVVILRTRAEQVGKQVDAALEDLVACQRMVKEMGVMKAKCEELLDGDK